MKDNHKHAQMLHKDDQNVQIDKKKFIPQGGDYDNNHTFSQRSITYLQHHYYTVKYSELTRWYDIKDTSLSPMSSMDDSPPTGAQMINIRETGGWYFLFYGHEHEVVYINPNGFLGLTDRICAWEGFCNWSQDQEKHYLRYVAPLMADFDPGKHDWSNIFYAIDNQSLIVQWDNIALFRHDFADITAVKDGFTFQVILSKTGSITFNYKIFPYFPGNETLDGTNQPNSQIYPTVMGVEDAALVEDILTPYLPVDLDWSKVLSIVKKSHGATINLDPLPTCHSIADCVTCYDSGSKKCAWCPESGRCTDIIGREKDGISASCFSHHDLIYDKNKCFAGKQSSNSMNSTTITLIVLFLLCGIIVTAFSIHITIQKKKENRYSKGVPDEITESPNGAVVGLDMEMSSSEIHHVIEDLSA